MPEIVNFKTGGAMKKFMTNGIVKGDVNGHIEGKRAKVAMALPIALAVYVPEGTAITEYQMLRLRVSGDSREFCSVTGGVIHESGGAKRDAGISAPEDCAPRLSDHPGPERWQRRIRITAPRILWQQKHG